MKVSKQITFGQKKHFWPCQWWLWPLGAIKQTTICDGSTQKCRHFGVQSWWYQNWHWRTSTRMWKYNKYWFWFNSTAWSPKLAHCAPPQSTHPIKQLRHRGQICCTVLCVCIHNAIHQLLKTEHANMKLCYLFWYSGILVYLHILIGWYIVCIHGIYRLLKTAHANMKMCYILWYSGI